MAESITIVESACSFTPNSQAPSSGSVKNLTGVQDSRYCTDRMFMCPRSPRKLSPVFSRVFLLPLFIYCLPQAQGWLSLNGST